MKNWDDLRIFHAMAKARSIRAAAADLRTTHATVSRRIRALEEDLGSALFERRNEGHVLTAFGQSMMDLTEGVSVGVEAIDRLAFGQDGSLAGPVRLSVLEDLYHQVLSGPLNSFIRAHPMIELSIETTPSLRDVSRREADVIVRITSNPPEQAVGRKVADSPLALYSSPHYLNQRPAIDRWIALDYPPAITPLLKRKTGISGWFTDRGGRCAAPWPRDWFAALLYGAGRSRSCSTARSGIDSRQRNLDSDPRRHFAKPARPIADGSPLPCVFRSAAPNRRAFWIGRSRLLFPLYSKPVPVGFVTLGVSQVQI